MHREGRRARRIDTAAPQRVARNPPRRLVRAASSMVIEADNSGYLGCRRAERGRMRNPDHRWACEPHPRRAGGTREGARSQSTAPPPGPSCRRRRDVRRRTHANSAKSGAHGVDGAPTRQSPHPEPGDWIVVPGLAAAAARASSTCSSVSALQRPYTASISEAHASPGAGAFASAGSQYSSKGRAPAIGGAGPVIGLSSIPSP